jgi:branched-chain amino acid transport system substrate-binding protein
MTDKPEFDVFLAHHSTDKSQVEAIASELRKRDLKPWLDKEQIPPGKSFQDVIQQAIPKVKSAAIFIGLEGLGDWQIEELRSLITQCTKKGIPAIPVLLPGVKKIPEKLLFLGERRWVNFLEKTSEVNALDELEWGITGKQPDNFQGNKISENPLASSPPQRSKQQNQYWWLLLFGLVSFALIGGVIGYFFGRQSYQISSSLLSLRKSLGEKILIQEKSSLNKKLGTEAFASGKIQEAKNKFELSLQDDKNDPETLIYLNNAKAGEPRFKIAVSTPIGNNPNIAQEILRGVAQAQEQVNSNGGINGALLKVELANDDNNKDIAQKIAKDFIKDPTILAVIGHNSSDVSMAAAKEYQQKLVMVSPTSNAAESLADPISPDKNYIFRTVPTNGVLAGKLADYIFNKAHKKKVVICFDSEAEDSQWFIRYFRSAYLKYTGTKISELSCELSSSNLKPRDVIKNALKEKEPNDGILIFPYVQRHQRALQIIQENNQRFALFSTPTLYTSSTLEAGANANGLVLVSPWHPNLAPSKLFIAKAKDLWGGPVTWRTAMAYDATLTIIEGLRQIKSDLKRDSLQKAISSIDFSVKQGTLGLVEFDPSGNRKMSGVLAKIRPSATTTSGYEFSLLNP